MSAVPSRLGDMNLKAETVVICHHGVRSIHVVQFLSRFGFGNVLNLQGGLDAYSDVDPSVPRYYGGEGSPQRASSLPCSSRPIDRPRSPI